MANFLLISLVTGSVYAQSNDNRSIPERVERSLQFLQKQTQATPEQQQKANPVYTNFYTRIDSLRASPNPKDKSALKSIYEERNQQLATFLSDTQMTQLKEAEKSMMQQRRQRKRGQVS